MRAWVYKVNSRGPHGRRRWHFDRYFSSRSTRPYPMGGTNWIRSPQSWAHLARVRAGDLFVCYQTDERRIYGFARAAGPGYESQPGSERVNAVDFTPAGLRLRSPVDVRRPEVRELFRHIRAFTVPSRGTIHPLATDELRELLRTVTRKNQSQKTDIREFLRTKLRR